MESRENIQRLLELHTEGVQDILKVYMGDKMGESEESESLEESLNEFEGSISEELKVVRRALHTISEALREISTDLTREIFYLGELNNSEDPQYQGFISREYGDLLDRLVWNYERMEKNYRLLEEKKEVWKAIMARLKALTETYPQINEKIQRQYDLLGEIQK